MSFPEVKNIENVYSIHLDSIKVGLFPTVCQEMDRKELTLFYLLEYLIGFQTIEMDTFYGQPNYCRWL